MDGFGQIGYVANSYHTVIGDSYSAGRLYDKIGSTAEGKIRFVTDKGVLCTLKQKDGKKDGKKENHKEEEADRRHGIHL